MFTKEQFLASFEHEIAIIRHLAGKLAESDMDYRPTESQRSIRELLQYLSYIFVSAAETLSTGDMGAYQRHAELSTEVTLSNFDERMQGVAAKVREFIAPMTDAQLAEVVDMWRKQTRGEHLVNGMLKWAAAYKTQLFTYMKQNGHSNLNTMNLWAGMDGSM